MRGIIYKQLFVHAKPLPSSVSLAGATAIVTGSNGGIGFEASRQLLRLGVRHLILAVRSQSRGDTAAAKLREEYPESRRIEVAILDMADYGSINAFLQFCHRLEYVDYVILNAGLQNQTFRRCDKTGHEMAFQVNCLSTGLLALSLATIMKSKKRPNNADPPVLSVVGSDTMWLSRFQPTDQFDPKDILINVCNPGLVGGTNLGSDATHGWLTKTVLRLFVSVLARPVQKGASNYIHALVAEGEKSHGSFVSDWDIKPYPRLLSSRQGPAVIDRPWEETMEELRRLGIDIQSQ